MMRQKELTRIYNLLRGDDQKAKIDEIIYSEMEKGTDWIDIAIKMREINSKFADALVDAITIEKFTEF